ncbi:MAG: hypothetical protein IH991_13370 [Planctomycetes bacterium]|nr:hypothetical protein [Planctomycetota bacterium]
MKRILTALLLLMLATPAWGQDFEKGLQAYERGDYVASSFFEVSYAFAARLSVQRN